MRRGSLFPSSTTHYPASFDDSSLSSWCSSGSSTCSSATPSFSASSSATASPIPAQALSSVLLSCTLASALCADSAAALSSAWPASSPLISSLAAALQTAGSSSSSTASSQMNSHSQLTTFDNLTPFPHSHTSDFSASSLKSAPFSSYPWLPTNSVVDAAKTALEMESNEDMRVPSTAALNLFLPDSNKPQRNDCLKVDSNTDMVLPLLAQGSAMVGATPSASPRHQMQTLPFIAPFDPTQSVHPSAANSRRPSLTAFSASPNAAIRRFFPSNPLQLAQSGTAAANHNQLMPAVQMPAHAQLHAADATERSPNALVKSEMTSAASGADAAARNLHKRKHANLQDRASDDIEARIPALDEKTRQVSNSTDSAVAETEGDDDEEDDEDEDDEDSADEDEDKDKHGGKATGVMANRFAADGLSCHQCKTRRTGAELLFCHHHKKKKSKKGGEKACRKKFCFRCIQKFYENLGSFEDLKQRELEYVCPGCRGDCSCASCRRSRTRKQMKALIKSQGFLPSQANQLVQTAFAMPNNAHTQSGKRAKLVMSKVKKNKGTPALMGAGSPVAVAASTVPVFMPQYVLNQQQSHAAHFTQPNVVQLCPPLLAPTAQQCHSAFASAAPSPSSASSHSTPLSTCTVSSLSSPALSQPSDRPSLSPALSVNSASSASSVAASAAPSSLPSPAGALTGNASSEVAYSAALSNLHGLTQELQTLISRQPELANQVFQMLQSQIKQHNERQSVPNLSANGNANAFNFVQPAQYQTAQAPMPYNAAAAIANAATALLFQSNPPGHFAYPQQAHSVDSIVPAHAHTQSHSHVHSQSQSQSLTHPHSHSHSHSHPHPHSHSHSHSHSLAQSHVHVHGPALTQSPLQSVSQPHSHGSSHISSAGYVCHPNSQALQ